MKSSQTLLENKFIQSSRQMDSKMKLGRSVLRDLLIIICLFVPCVTIWLSNAVISLVWKVCAYVQSEWERFNDIYFDNTAVGKDVDLALLTYIKGEDSVAGPCCCNHTSTSREVNKKSKLRHHFLVIVNSVAHALLFVPEKIYAYVQRVSEEYNNLYGDSMVELPYKEPAFIVYLKGEEGAPFLKNPHVIFSKSDSRDLKNFPQSSGNGERSNQRQGKNGKVSEGLSLVRLIYELCCHIRSAVSALYFRCSHLTFCRQVNGEKHVQTCQAETRHNSFNKRKTQNYDKAPSVHYSRQAVKLQENVAARPVTVPSSPAFAVRSNQGRLFKCSGALQTAWSSTVNLKAPSNSGPKLWSSSLHSGAGRKQWNSSPAVDKRAETQVKLFSEGKANTEVMQPSNCGSKAAFAGSASVCTIKTEKKVEERVTPFLYSIANVETPAPSSPVTKLGKGKVMPSLIPTSHVPVLPRVKAQDKEKDWGVVRSNQVRSANVCADSQAVATHSHDTHSVEQRIEVKGSTVFPRVTQTKNKKGCRISRKNPLSGDAHLRQTRTVKFRADFETDVTHNHVTSSLEEQIGAEPEVSAVKRAKIKKGCLKDTSSLGDVHSSQFYSANVSKRTRNEEECKQPRPWDAQACINSNEHPSNITLGRSMRLTKRKAESSSDAISNSKQTEVTSRQIHRVDSQKTAEQQELMEVVESPPERAFTELPESMEIGGEENAKIFSFTGELSEAKAPVSASFLVELESMETNQEKSGIFFEKVQTEEMDTDQASVFDDISFAWANVMQSLLVQSAEELMETDQESVTASPCVVQLEAIMEATQEPFQMVIPFGQVGDTNLPVATGMGTSEATFTIPVYEETMETQELDDAYKPVETKLGDLTDAKRPLASTVGMLKEENMLTNTPAAEEPVLQTVKDLAMPPLKERAKPPPLLKTELPQSTRPRALMLSEHLQRMEDKFNNEPGFVAIEQQQLVAVETDETKSASQLAMEQLQLVPEDPYFHDGFESESGSDDSSDDEYELDLATIDEFSELHTEPEHVQLIMKLLTERELALEQ